MGQEWNYLKEKEMSKYLHSPEVYLAENIKPPLDKLRPGAEHESARTGLEPQFDYFSDTYSLETLKDDQTKLEERRAQFEKKTKQGEIGEYILMEGIYEFGWLKPDIEVIPTQEYDDVMKQVDFVLRFEGKEGAFSYLGVDVTTTKDIDKILKKRERLVEYLKGGSLGSLKYFEDQDADIKGEFEMPKIIIVLSPDQVSQMLQVMVNERIRRKLTPAERSRLTPEEKAEFVKDKKIAERIQSEVEAEVIAQLELMCEAIGGLMELTKVNAQKKKYLEFQQAYKKVLNELKEEG